SLPKSFSRSAAHTRIISARLLYRKQTDSCPFWVKYWTTIEKSLNLGKNLDLRGTPLVDEHGALWMEIRESGREFKVGLSANNILAPASDSLGAYELLLARTNTILKSPKHSRESMLEFRRDWAVQQRASERS